MVFDSGDAVLDCGCGPAKSDRRCVELRALCNDAPQTPPGPEGSNGSGNASGAAEDPKFLSSSREKFFSAL